MATGVQYFTAIRNMQRNICRRLGVSVEDTELETRAVAAANIATVCVVVKALTDAGVITDQQLSDAWETIRQEDWPPEPIGPIRTHEPVE